MGNKCQKQETLTLFLYVKSNIFLY